MRRIFYDNVTGEVIIDVQYQNGKLTTVERSIAQFKILSERNRDTFDVLELEYGQYAQDFAEGRLIGVDLEKNIPLFSYPNPNEPGVEQPSQVPLSEKIATLEQEKTILQLALAETIEKQEIDKVNGQIALAELVETLIIQGVL